MPCFDILRQSEPSTTWRVAKMRSAYDLTANRIIEHFQGELELPDSWQIGVITGHSGTGKSTIARELWPDSYITQFEYSAPSVIDDFPKTLDDEELFKTLHRVGFGSIPSWLKPYNVLSQGECMRVDLARAILSDRKLIVFDEFTSTVDRDVAKFVCAAVKKAVRETKKQLIVVSCHDDFIDWLAPDWVFSTNDMRLKKKLHVRSQLTSKCVNVRAVCGRRLENITISITL